MKTEGEKLSAAFHTVRSENIDNKLEKAADLVYLE